MSSSTNKINITDLSRRCDYMFIAIRNAIDRELFSQLPLSKETGELQANWLEFKRICSAVNACDNVANREPFQARLVRIGRLDLANEFLGHLQCLEGHLIEARSVLSAANKKQKLLLDSWNSIDGQAGKHLRDSLEGIERQIQNLDHLYVSKLKSTLDAYINTGFIYPKDPARSDTYAAMDIASISDLCFASFEYLLRDVDTFVDPETETLRGLHHDLQNFCAGYNDLVKHKGVPLDERLQDRGLVNGVKMFLCDIEDHLNKACEITRSLTAQQRKAPLSKEAADERMNHIGNLEAALDKLFDFGFNHLDAALGK
ncbi:hypothetical protein BJX64DRAFT_293514 [Aspergillus heterothallicus]